jgi:hypothetical protein
MMTMAAPREAVAVAAAKVRVAGSAIHADTRKRRAAAGNSVTE